MRSKLFVPGTRADFFEKALRGQADALSFDLEDSVASDAKPAARVLLAEFLQSDGIHQSAKTIIVRVNACGTEDLEQDLAALGGAHLHFINLPKIDDAEMAAAAAEQVVQARADAHLLLNIETPRGLARAAGVASAHPSIAGLQVGLNDLFEPLNIDRSRLENIHPVLWQVRMAAAEAKLFAYDGAWADLHDMEGFSREAEMAKNLGFLGKSCIHPSQVEAANRIFDRGNEVAAARRILAAAKIAGAAGQGAFLLDGKMIDAPAIEQAEAVLASAGDAE